MKRRIQIVTVCFLVVTSGLVGLGLMYAPPPAASTPRAPLEIAIASTPQTIRVGQTWHIGLVVTNTTNDDVTIAAPRLGGQGVRLTISFRSTDSTAGNEPDEIVELERIWPESEAAGEPVVLGGNKSREFELIAFPAVRAGSYEIAADFAWAAGQESIRTAEAKQVIVMAGEVAGEQADQLRMVFHTKSEDGQTGALRFQFLPKDGLATAIHVAAIASGEKGYYQGSPVQSTGGAGADQLGFGARPEGAAELGYALFASATDDRVAKEDNLAGLVVEAGNADTGRGRFEVVLGPAPEGWLGTHLPFARLVGGERHANELATGERDDKGFLKPRVVVERVEFEPKAE